MILPHFYKTTYTETDLDALFSIAGIQSDAAEVLRTELEDAAAKYRWQSARTTPRISNRDLQRELETVLRPLDKLRETLEALSEDARWELHKGFEFAASTEISNCIVGGLTEAECQHIVQIPAPDGTFEALAIELSELERLISGLHEVAKTVRDNPRKHSPGRSRDWGLYIWMTDIKCLWETATGTRFTRDVTQDGIPITPAARFCEIAFKAIDPNTPTSLVMREMKDCISRNRSTTGRIVPRSEA